MAKDLTTSAIERQNVLNNNLAIPRIQEALDVEAYFFEGKYYLTKRWWQISMRWTLEQLTIIFLPMKKS